MNIFKLRQCMGATDEAYLKRFGELPFDTLERLQKDGFTPAEAWNTVNGNVRTVTEILRKDYEEALEREFEDCPF